VATTYRDALQYLYGFTDVERIPGLAPAAGFDLAKVHRFFDLLGRPETRFRSVLVAGTKGKGSTASFIAGALRAAGYRTGLYSQPHLTTFRERLQIDGRLLPEDRLGPLVDRIRPVVARMHATAPEFGPLTTYEIATGLALLFFAAEAVDYAVLEIGLGGRLDAVNTVRAPLVSAITSLSLDHTRVLGDTLGQIAFEKAGIIKPGIPVVSAPQPAEAEAVITRTAAERGAALYQVGGDLTVAGSDATLDGPCSPGAWGRPRRSQQHTTLALGPRLRAAAPGWPESLPLTLPLLGQHQTTNAAVAAGICALLSGAGADRLTPAAAQTGFATVLWPGRLETAATRPLIVLDGAHNGDSAQQLATALPANFCYRDLVLVLGVSADKDSAAILRPLVPLARQIICTQSGHPRAATPETVAAVATALAGEPGSPSPAPPVLQLAPDATAALALARTLATPDDAILVTGSLFVVGDARAALGLAPAADPVGGDFFYRLDKTAKFVAGP